VTPPSDEPDTQAHVLVERVFAMLCECRTLLPKLERPRQPNERPSAEAERILYSTLVSALENGLVRAMEDLVSVCSLRDRGPVPVYLPKRLWRETILSPLLRRGREEPNH